MLELNKILVVGRLTQDPEIRTTGTGKSVAKLNLAINRRGYGGRDDEVCYVEVVVWEKSAEFASNYLHKGSAVYVEGRLNMESWQDRETGAKRTKLNIMAERLTFAESKSEAGGQKSNDRRQPDTKASATSDARIPPGAEDEQDQGLPF